MASYTMTLKEMLKTTPLFDFEYTMDETYITKELLEKLIIQRYLYYEIGAETIDRFKVFFINDYLLKLIELTEKLKAYNKLMTLENYTNKQEYSYNTNSSEDGRELYPPMSSMTNSPSIDKYSRTIEKNTKNVGTNGYTTTEPLKFYKEINAIVYPHIEEFIDSLKYNFMGVM